MTPTLNIAALTQRTGVPADTIRKWEQRYGVLRPERTPGGQRRYTDLDVARVEWLKARLREGYRIGEAAALLGDVPTSAPDADELRRAVVHAALRSDSTSLARAVEQALVIESLEDAFARVLSPALVEIGDLWEAGHLTVAQEHLATATVGAALGRLLAGNRSAVRGVAVLACAPGERHEIGLSMVGVLLRADGWQVAYLGADTPTADAVALANELDARALLFSATQATTAAALAAELEAVAPGQERRVLVGGRAGGGSDAAAAVAALR